jgi:hypothetical protein
MFLGKDLLGHRPRTKSMVRWGSEFAVAKEIFEHFDGVTLIVFSNDPFSDNLRENMRELMDNAVVGDDGLTSLQRLRLELAIYVDVGEALYEFVYSFEGDGLLAPFIHTNMIRIMCLYNVHISSPFYSATVCTFDAYGGTTPRLCYLYLPTAMLCSRRFSTCSLSSRACCPADGRTADLFGNGADLSRYQRR